MAASSTCRHRCREWRYALGGGPLAALAPPARNVLSFLSDLDSRRPPRASRGGRTMPPALPHGPQPGSFPSTTSMGCPCTVSAALNQELTCALVREASRKSAGVSGERRRREGEKSGVWCVSWSPMEWSLQNLDPVSPSAGHHHHRPPPPWLRRLLLPVLTIPHRRSRKDVLSFSLPFFRITCKLIVGKCQGPPLALALPCKRPLDSDSFCCRWLARESPLQVMTDGHMIMPTSTTQSRSDPTKARVTLHATLPSSPYGHLIRSFCQSATAWTRCG